jgi:PAS domain S-box-containing protein
VRGGNDRAVSLPFKRVLIPLFLLIALLAGLTAFSVVSRATSLKAARERVDHTHKVIIQAGQVYQAVQGAQAGQVAFLATGNPAYRDQYRLAMAALPSQLAELRGMTGDNPNQRRNLADLDAAVRERLDTMAASLRAKAAGDDVTALAPLREGQVQAQMARITLIYRQVVAEETRLLSLREVAAANGERLNLIVTILLSLVSLAGLGLGVLVLGRSNAILGQALAAQQAAQASQRDSEALYRAVFTNAADFIFVIGVHEDGGFSLQDLNPAAEAATGFNAARLRGKRVEALAPPAVAERLNAYYRRVAEAGGPVLASDTLTLPIGKRDWESVLVPVRGESGRIERIVGSSRDVTERKLSEEQARRSQRMEAVGQLTGGVAHDFNNLLQVIQANLELLAPSITDPKARARLESALHGADRAASLTRQLLAFARRQPLEPVPLNLGRMLSDLAELLRRTLGEAVEVETVVAAGLWDTLADPAQVESAILNLALNARDAMPGGGRLTLELSNSVLDEAYVRGAQDIQPGQYVLLAVSDTGEGMDPEVLGRVFEPFFTTKPDGKGTGLGLSMVYGFVKQSNGHVQVYSEPGQGTTVRIYLPRTRQAVVRAVAQPTSNAARGEVVLVVEDEAGVRQAACAILNELGYRTLDADGPIAALGLLGGEEPVDLLFTDVVMPGDMKTPDFVRRARQLRPGLAVLYASGYTENAIIHHGRLDEGVLLLSKPYGREDLARKAALALRRVRPAVLVVEDEALVREATVQMIADLGFEPLSAPDGPSAIEILRSDVRVDVLFTDLGLPGMRGDALATQARALRPDLRVVIASGYSGDLSEVDGAKRLDKPYDRAALAAALQKPES